jgi:hypothetical protein
MDVTWQQIVALCVIAIPIACVARTVVFEEVFREAREFCRHRSTSCRSLVQRKFFYLFTCEYCFSHWVTLAALLLIAAGPGRPFYLIYPDWRGYVLAFFSLVFLANAYLNLYARLRVDITSEKKVIEVREREAELAEKHIEAKEMEIRKLDAELDEVSEDKRRPNRDRAGDGDPRASRV